ncbi:hypothetical protein V1509DRAFT_619930 [Lipomyces kononenkoae]
MSPVTIGNIMGMPKESLSKDNDGNVSARGRTSTSQSATVNSGRRDVIPPSDPVVLDNSPTNAQTAPGLGDPAALPGIAEHAVPESATNVGPDHVPQKLKQFVDERPNERYILDGDDQQTKICRFEQNGKKCLNLAASPKDVLSQMQKLDFYCALGQDVGRSEFECRKIL